MELDRTDRKILSILQQDGRIANVELAERIGLSPTSVGERLKRLQREGFVEGYGARLNPHRLGLGLPESEKYMTIAGFLLAQAGRLVGRDEVVKYEGALFTVESMEGRRILRVRYTPAGGRAYAVERSGS